ncbi:MAG TPA: diguanylate cyclase [Gemmatimonadales bacterium]|nr:diguanylate cyclase [Gemmatimonadales bacterium]
MRPLLARLGLGGIKNQLVAFAVAATLIPALTTAWLSYVQNRRSLTAKIAQELTAAGAQAARELDLWSKERLYELRVFGASYEVSENLERWQRQAARPQAQARLRDYLSSIHDRFRDYDELLVVDPSGNAVASSSPRPGTIRLEGEWPRRLRSEEALLGDPYRDDDGLTRLAIAVPVIAASGRFLGGIVARISVRTAAAPLATFAPGGSGGVIIADRTGAVISTDSAAPGASLSADAVQRMRAGAGAAVEYRDQSGVPVVGSLVDVSQLSWSVVAAIPQADAYAQVTRLRNVTLLLLAALLVLVGSLAYGLGGLMVRPLSRLTQGASQVATGNLEVGLPVTAGGEIGYLTQVFNDMVVRLRNSRQELERLTVTDTLTDLSNRRHLMATLDQELKRCARHERACAVLMLDVDHFKQYNDSHGHLAGDEVLARVGKTLRATLRSDDLAARYGGEEFAVVLPEADARAGVEVAERIRTRLAAETFQVGGDGQSAGVTLSIGVAAFPASGTSAQALLASADAALYQAKKAGRNRVAAAGEPKPRPSRRAT